MATVAPGMYAGPAHDLLSLWHAFRLEILLGLSILWASVKLVIWLRKGRQKLSQSPVPGSPVDLDRRGEDKRHWLARDVRAESGPAETRAADTIGIHLPVQPERNMAARLPKKVSGKRWMRKATEAVADSHDKDTLKVEVLVFYASVTGATEASAKEFVELLSAALDVSSMQEGNYAIQLLNISSIDYDEYFASIPRSTNPMTSASRHFYFLLVPTYNIDSILNTFLSHLQDIHYDFRVPKAPLSSLLGYSVFGFGDRQEWPTEEEGFCSQAIQLDRWMAKLTGGKRAFPLGLGDVSADGQDGFREWTTGAGTALKDVVREGGLGEGVMGSGDAVESDEDEDEDGEEEEASSTTKITAPSKRRRVDVSIQDVEELGQVLQRDKPSNPRSPPLPIDFTSFAAHPQPSPPIIKEMVPLNSPTHAALTKQGYTIVGSHSGVKICRWTKSALRGRGSCYKHSFYGIESHLCMESTPSLSCSNKCVFCWRHGTNPVSTTWKWTVDPPDMILAGVKAGHRRKINMLKGVPGVWADRFSAAMTRIRHCALSLVGEPIFYPHINELVTLLHAERISTFLVCNAQHPDQLASLTPVTQLYVSVDASNRDSLRRIDRPLHRDFWDRFLRCLDIIRARRLEQRTVFRLTLVKGFNMADEVDGYAALVARALPAFVEVKGVTFCGTSPTKKSRNRDDHLTMANVPFYAEVQAFVLELHRALKLRHALDYGVAAEHQHSCCVLLASTPRFCGRDGRWRTHIDYDRFFDLLDEKRRGLRDSFRPEDYIGAETPEWAAWGRGGFDPADVRVDRKGRRIEL